MEFYPEEEKERSELYRLFSSLFMEEPESGVILQIREMFQMKFEDSIEEIKRDFIRLFLGPDLHLSPHESLHNYPLGEIPRLWGRATEEVQAMYHSAGLMIDDESDLIPDHLGVELLFMSYLVENDRVEQQRKFMDEHLLLWIEEYCGEVEKHAVTTFYKEVAILLKEFVVSDGRTLSGGS
jgi:TorA maturation chaperone TorD